MSECGPTDRSCRANPHGCDGSAPIVFARHCLWHGFASRRSPVRSRYAPSRSRWKSRTYDGSVGESREPAALRSRPLRTLRRPGGETNGADQQRKFLRAELGRWSSSPGNRVMIRHLPAAGRSKNARYRLRAPSVGRLRAIFTKVPFLFFWSVTMTRSSEWFGLTRPLAIRRWTLFRTWSVVQDSSRPLGSDI